MEEKAKKVSAIITTHNRVDVLSRAIYSVLNQTYSNLELVVVSDGSTDGTDDYMKQFENNNRVKYISYYPGKGGNYARNQGILNATGDYVAFLDDDDEWYPEKIEKQIKLIDDEEKIGLVYVGKNIIYVNQNITYNSISSLPADTAQSILIDNFIGTTSCVLAKRDIVIECGMFDERLKALQDWDLWIRICQKCPIGSIDEPLIYYYNYLTTNQISAKTNLYEQSIKYIEDKYKQLYNKLPDEKKKEHQYGMYLLLAQKCARNNQRSQSRAYLKKAYEIKKGLNPILLSILSFFPFYVNLYLHKLISVK